MGKACAFSADCAVQRSCQCLINPNEEQLVSQGMRFFRRLCGAAFLSVPYQSKLGATCFTRHVLFPPIVRCSVLVSALSIQMRSNLFHKACAFSADCAVQRSCQCLINPN